MGSTCKFHFDPVRCLAHLAGGAHAVRGLRDEVQLSDGGIIIVNNKINREVFDAVMLARKNPARTRIAQCFNC